MIFGQERTRDSSFWLAFLLGVAQTKKQNALHTVRPVRPSTSASFCPWQRNGSCWRLSAELWVYRGGYRWNAERCRCSNPFCKWFWIGFWVPKHRAWYDFYRYTYLILQCVEGSYLAAFLDFWLPYWKDHLSYQLPIFFLKETSLSSLPSWNFLGVSGWYYMVFCFSTSGLVVLT